ncbi:hypothetical protein LSAT2_028923 [Lamellibrachia satsuma]|nr:hypothetical protein LSAT2_028923 [Lamellibrachia satsuma]
MSRSLPDYSDVAVIDRCKARWCMDDGAPTGCDNESLTADVDSTTDQFVSRIQSDGQQRTETEHFTPLAAELVEAARNRRDAFVKDHLKWRFFLRRPPASE